MQDAPSAADLIDAVIVFLRERAIPALPDHAAFEARVAANALQMVQREISIGRSGEAAERERLTAILGCDGTLAALNAQLADGLANGAISVSAPAVRAHLWATTLEKLAVDQPRYAAYRRAIGQDT